MGFDPIGFDDLTTVAGLVEPTEAAIEKTRPETCPFSGGTVLDNGETYHICKLVAEAIGESNACHERVCRICICNGKPSTADNAYLRRHVLAYAWTLTVANDETEGPVFEHDLKARCEIATANVQRLAGDAVAKRFVDALVFNVTVTPETGADLLAKADLLGVA